jgi:hypothetical protein
LKEIKTKTVIKNIKMLAKKAGVYRRTKNVYASIKHQTEQHRYNDEGNYINEAGNSIGKGTETIIREAVRAVRINLKKAKEKIKDRRYSPNAEASHSNAAGGEQKQHAPAREEKETLQKNVIQTEVKPAIYQNTTKIRQNIGQSSSQPTRKMVMQPPNSPAKVIYIKKRPIEAVRKGVKVAAKGRVRIPQRSVKTAEYTARTAIKDSQTSIKTAAKTVKTTQSALQTMRVTARTAAVSAKTATRVLVASVKAIIAATKSAVALIAAGGWIAVVIILVICLIGSVLNSVFGVFFSNESSGSTTLVMSEAVSQINEELMEKIQQIQDDNPHDTLDMPYNNSSIVCNWHDILAVYAVKAFADPENGMEIATLDNTKLSILRNIFWNMNHISHWVESVEHNETVGAIDKDGNETKKEVITTETILHIRITSESYEDMISAYGFNVQQEKMLDELMDDEYVQLFVQLIDS